jgi:large subunit ribosomal protein L5
MQQKTKTIKAEKGNEKISRQKSKQENPMTEVKFEKVVLHATTSDRNLLEKYVKLLELITKKKATFTKAIRRIQAFKIRPGLEIGCKVTIRGKEGIELTKRLLRTIDNKLTKKQIQNGFVSFGIKEYIEIPGVDYQRELGILGFDVTITLSKVGKRVGLKKIKKSKLGNRQRVNKQETINFLKNKFDIIIE